MDRNPISKVRTSAKRLRESDALSPAEIASLLAELNLRERTMVMLAGSTGLRRSELVALTWSDMDLELMQVNVRRSCVRNHFGDTKTEASRKPVPLHPSVVKCLQVWWKDLPYAGKDDFLFPSIRRNGKQPLSPDILLKKIVRPTVERAGIMGKAIGWHSFRHSLATNLRAAGVDLKTAQELLRHANSRITLDVYTRAISATKREANNRVMTMVLEADKKKAPSPLSTGAKGRRKRCGSLQHPQRRVLILPLAINFFFRFMAGTTGLEPATSAVTGQRSNQLSYVPRRGFDNLVQCH